jgi:hypothetical protein
MDCAFFIILDGFEQYLRAPHDRAGIAEFEYELVRMINEPSSAGAFSSFAQRRRCASARPFQRAHQGFRRRFSALA